MIDDLDNMASLQAGYSKWDAYWKQLRTIRAISGTKKGLDVGYHPNEEMWQSELLESLKDLKDEEARLPWQYAKGFNEGMGDKFIFLKG